MLLALGAVEIGRLRTTAQASLQEVAPSLRKGSDLKSDLSIGKLSPRSIGLGATSEMSSIRETDELVPCMAYDREGNFRHFGGPHSQHSMSDHSSDIVLSQCEPDNPPLAWDHMTREFFRKNRERLENHDSILIRPKPRLDSPQPLRSDESSRE